MALPTFVNLGTFGTFSAVATVTPALPGSRTNNNILFAYVNGATAGSKTFAVGGGWTIGDQKSDVGSQSTCWAWRLVDGTEAAPVFTWTGNMTGSAQVFQYTGNATVGPIHLNNKAGAAASTTLTIAAITTTVDNCRIIDILLTAAGQTIPIPPDFTTRANSSSGGGYRWADGALGKAGTTPAVSVAVTSTDWNSYGIALKGSGAGTSPVRATQVAKQVIEGYTDSNTVRATQVTKQVIEAYSNPNPVRVTQVSMQVLRTESSVSTSLPKTRSQIIG